MTYQEHLEYSRKMKDYFNELKQDKNKMRDFFVKTGIYDKEGNLTENYK